MASGHFPVRPNLDQLKHRTKDLLRAFRRYELQARAVFRECLPEALDPSSLLNSRTHNLCSPLQATLTITVRLARVSRQLRY
jgi:hypothetical protein